MQLSESWQLLQQGSGVSALAPIQPLEMEALNLTGQHAPAPTNPPEIVEVLELGCLGEYLDKYCIRENVDGHRISFAVLLSTLHCSVEKTDPGNLSSDGGWCDGSNFRVAMAKPPMKHTVAWRY